MKWVSSSTWANVTTYGKLGFLVVVAMSDSSLMEYLGREPIALPAVASDILNFDLPEGLVR